MIILIPLLILLISLYVGNISKKLGETTMIVSMLSGMFLGFTSLFLLLSYIEYVNNLATLEYCKEAVDEKTLELDETIAINKTKEIYENKFSKFATHTKNNDTPIASTQEYLEGIQRSRLQERERCLYAKRNVLSFRLGLFGFAQ